MDFEIRNHSPKWRGEKRNIQLKYVCGVDKYSNRIESICLQRIYHDKSAFFASLSISFPQFIHFSFSLSLALFLWNQKNANKQIQNQTKPNQSQKQQQQPNYLSHLMNFADGFFSLKVWFQFHCCFVIAVVVFAVASISIFNVMVFFALIFGFFFCWKLV